MSHSFQLTAKFEFGPGRLREGKPLALKQALIDEASLMVGLIRLCKGLIAPKGVASMHAVVHNDLRSVDGSITE